MKQFEYTADQRGKVSRALMEVDSLKDSVIFSGNHNDEVLTKIDAVDDALRELRSLDKTFKF
jgi:hypothetical protein